MISNVQLTALVTFFLVVAIPVLFWLLRTPAASTAEKPLFTPSGRAFFGQLDMAVRSHCLVFPEIPIASLIQAKSFSRGGSLLARFKNDSFDYVICDRKTIEIKCVITHNTKPYPSLKKTEALARLCQYAGLTLLHFDEKPYRNVPVLRKQIFISCGIDDSVLPANHKHKYTIAISQDKAGIKLGPQDKSDQACAEQT